MSGERERGGMRVEGGSLPLFSACTYNPNSMKQYPKSGKQSAQKASKTRRVRDLAKTHDLVFLQKTKFNWLERSAMKAQLPNHDIFYNNTPGNTMNKVSKNKAGTAIIMKKEISERYRIREVGLPEIAKGYIQALILTPSKLGKSMGLWASVLVINCYMYTGPRQNKTQIELVEAIKALTKRDFTLVGGDFNFVEGEEDATNRQLCKKRGKKLENIWDKVKEKFGLMKVEQDLHTFFSISKEQGLRSSRIDRWYISRYESLLSIYTPKAYTQYGGGTEKEIVRWSLSPLFEISSDKEKTQKEQYTCVVSHGGLC